MTYHEIDDILNADLFKSPFNTSCSHRKAKFSLKHRKFFFLNVWQLPKRLLPFKTESVACKVN